MWHVRLHAYLQCFNLLCFNPLRLYAYTSLYLNKQILAGTKVYPHVDSMLCYITIQVHAINSMVKSFLVGVVGVKASCLKEFCLAYPTSILEDLESEFPKLVAEKADHLVCDIKASQSGVYLCDVIIITYVCLYVLM